MASESEQGNIAQPTEAATGVALNSKHIDNMITVLEEQHAIVELPRETLDFVLPSLGNRATHVITGEISYHLRPCHHHQGSGRYMSYRQDYLESVFPKMKEDLRLLCTLEGGVDEAWELCRTMYEDDVDDAEGMSSAQNISLPYFESIREALDDLNIMVMQRKIGSAKKEGKSRNPEEVRADMRARVFGSIRFERGLAFIENWHARNVGLVLAEKVAGHRLPPELVELISECFYDKELLKSLGG